jgi:lipoate-protein ligase A
MSHLRFWWDVDADGGSNMGADECLAMESQRRGGLLVRIYGWRSTTVSLGRFQKLEDARGVAGIGGVPLVRRPSGGGAIVHGSDLTYAAAVPKGHAWGASPQRLYDAMHGAMAGVLATYGIPAMLHAAAPTAAGGRTEDEPFFCFDRRSAGDIVVGLGGRRPVKVMGSAQRRLEGVVLQHGSLLLRGNPDVTGGARHPGITDLPGFRGDPSDRRELPRRWLERVAVDLGAELVEEPEDFHRVAADELAELSRRFLDDGWTSRR